MEAQSEDRQVEPDVVASVTHNPYSGKHGIEHATPQEFFDRINRVWRFTLDVCATRDNHKVNRFFCPPEAHTGTPGVNTPGYFDSFCGSAGIDGLSQDWHEDVCWMNPPFARGKLVKWVQKAVTESRRGAVVIALLPAGIDTAWFHTLVAPNARVINVDGRIKFVGSTSGAKTPNIIAEFLPPEYGSAKAQIK